MPQFKIAKKNVGDGSPCFIIAEIGINHNGSVELAKKMIDVAAQSGVDAVKLQTFKAAEIVSDKSETYTYTSQGKKVTESMYEMFKRCELDESDYAELLRYAAKKKIICFSTPQNESDLDLLLNIGVPAIKVGSDDLTNIPLMEYFSRQKLPLIISTGMSYLKEVKETVKVIRRHNKQIGILHCVSSYPAAAEELNLERITALKKEFPEAVIGFSDHSVGVWAAVVAVSLGAKIYERHYTLDHSLPGPDHRFSANPMQLKGTVEAIRETEKALGKDTFEPSKNEQYMRSLCRRSLVAKSDLPKKHVITVDDIIIRRPGTGLAPKEKKNLVGKKLSRSVKANHVFKWSDF